MWVQFAHARHCFTGGGWEGVIGRFKGGLGFNDAAGDMFKSACITVIVELGLLGPAHLITHLHHLR